MIKTKSINPTKDMAASVRAYLTARAHAETMREAVDKLQRKILEEVVYKADEKAISRGRGERILNPKDAWLMGDDDHMEYLVELKYRLKENGFTVTNEDPEDPASYSCPALVAESLQRDTERLVIESTAEFLGEDPKDFHHRLMCAGVKKFEKFIELSVGLVVNHPDFKEGRI
ncbi:MAG: hypothetical protein KC944_23360, partial [Candidatus Omnitrophica bacterium]|nr:hypothetical protein [Candidatus Omnitrophota bacterium]